MKSLVVYSSRTGNTKAIGEAIADAVGGADIFAAESMPSDVDGYDLIFVGFWARRRGADEGAQAVLSSLHGANVAVFGTGGVYPDSEKAREYAANAQALLSKDNVCLGTFMCQGRVHSFHVRKLGGTVGATHEMNAERLERLEEAERHPNEEDFRRAREWARSMAEAIQR